MQADRVNMIITTILLMTSMITLPVFLLFCWNVYSKKRQEVKQLREDLRATQVLAGAAAYNPAAQAFAMLQGGQGMPGSSQGTRDVGIQGGYVGDPSAPLGWYDGRTLQGAEVMNKTFPAAYPLVAPPVYGLSSPLASRQGRRAPVGLAPPNYLAGHYAARAHQYPGMMQQAAAQQAAAVQQAVAQQAAAVQQSMRPHSPVGGECYYMEGGTGGFPFCPGHLGARTYNTTEEELIVEEKHDKAFENLEYQNGGRHARHRSDAYRGERRCEREELGKEQLNVDDLGCAKNE